MSAENKPSPGVLLLGLEMLAPAAFVNPYVLNRVWPNLFVFRPGLWNDFLLLSSVWLLIALLMVWQWRRIGRSAPAQLVFSRIPAIGGALLMLATLVIFLIGFESVFWRITTYQARNSDQLFDNSYTVPIYDYDPLLGLRGPKNVASTHRCYIKNTQETLYEKTYTFDEHGYRVVPQAEGPKDYHLALFGCSFTFGIGVNDDETRPALLAAAHPEAHVYSFAFGSYGPGQAALQLQHGVMDKVAEQPGAGVFVFMNDHVRRLIPGMKHVTKWTREFPAFGLDEQGNAAYLGPFSKVYARRIFWLEILAREKYVRWSGLDFPIALQPADFALCGAVLGLVRDEYKKRYPENAFYVVIDPVCFSHFNLAALKPELEARKLVTLEAKKIYGEEDAPFYYPLDRHPRPAANVKFAAWFWEQFPDGLMAGPRKAAE